MAQILFLSSQNSLSVVTFPSQTVEQIAVCEPIVYLEAIVDGDLTGHSFGWVQISGSPTVTLLPVPGYDTRTYYTVTGLPGTDKVFRFYIDRYTPYEQFLDLTVRTTPATYGLTLNYGVGDYTTIPNDNLFPADSKIVVTAPYNYSNDFSSGAAFAPNPATVEIPKPEVFFQSSDDDVYFRDVFVGYVFQQVVNNEWQTISTVGISGPYAIAINTSSQTRVGAIYRKGIGSSETVIYYDVPLAVSSSMMPATEKLGILKYSAENFTEIISAIIFVTSLQTYDDTTFILPYSFNYDYSLQQIVYSVSLLTYDDPTITVPLSYSYNYTFSVTRTVDGGGSVGG